MTKLLHWPNGVDKARHMSKEPETDIREKFGIPESHLVVLAVSRLYFEKHVDRVVEAALGVEAARDDVTFLIVGSGEERGHLERLVSSLSLSHRVIFAGSAGREELPDYYKAADVFVALSDRTNVSNSLHEAMISGLPVVVLNTGSTADVVRDGETGILIEEGELERVPDALLSLLDDSELRRAMGERAQRDADERLRTLDERQVMEAEVAERAVRERAGRDRA
jgi:phosphatidylinositol alpha-1,6-mannosyltransferase